jgi:hypothetical protein
MPGRDKPTTNPHSRSDNAEAKSCITNGKLFAAEVDGRTRAARRWCDVYRHYLENTRGTQRVLCRSLASLVVERELLDAASGDRAGQAVGVRNNHRSAPHRLLGRGASFLRAQRRRTAAARQKGGFGVGPSALLLQPGERTTRQVSAVNKNSRGLAVGRPSDAAGPPPDVYARPFGGYSQVAKSFLASTVCMPSLVMKYRPASSWR